MRRVLLAVGDLLHAQRRWLLPLFGVLAAASLAYGVEEVIINGPPALLGILPLVAVGAVMSGLLAWIMAFDVLAARRHGVVLHVALLRKRSWQRRHEIEHDLLLVQ